MRVLHVIAGAEIGGAETFAQDAITSLHAQGVAQHMQQRRRRTGTSSGEHTS